MGAHKTRKVNFRTRKKDKNAGEKPRLPGGPFLPLQ
jgi:hypothetical protein